MLLNFDFDGVLSDDESERVYARENLAAFQRYEVEHADKPHGAGLLKDLVLKIAALQRIERERALQAPEYRPIIRIAVVTARNAPAHERMIHTLDTWGLAAAELFLMGGVEKKRVLQALRPHMFFDDQRAHLESAAEAVPSVHIPFGVRNAANQP